MTLHILMEMHLQVLSCLHCSNSVWGTFVMNAAQTHSDVWFILYIVSLHAQRTCSLCVVSWTVSLKWKPCHNESCLPLFSSRIYIWKACQLVSTYWELQLAVELVPEYIYQWGGGKQGPSVTPGSGYHSLVFNGYFGTFTGLKWPQAEADH
jgi:hypothetical protein